MLEQWLLESEGVSPGGGSGVGRGNKFVLLDITEEPEAKKLTVYNTNEI